MLPAPGIKTWILQHDVLEHPFDASHRASVLGVPPMIGEIKRIDILLNRTREDYATRSELKRTCNKSSKPCTALKTS